MKKKTADLPPVDALYCPVSKDGFILEMKGVCKSFPGVVALDDVSLFIRPGTVHALMGENGAGKSTLMKCLFGIYHQNAGEILYGGELVNFKTPKEALDRGVSMVHQELNQVVEQRVMDNIWLGRFPMKRGLVDEKKMLRETKKIFAELNIDINPQKKLDDLSVSERQMVEIAKAVSYNSHIIVFDEPTSSLTEKEVDHLFRIINQLKERSCGMVYISHKMEEIFKISDDITVMRDGKTVFTDRAENMTMDQIVSLMVGRSLEQRFPDKLQKPSTDVLLSVKGLTGTYQPSVNDVSFDLYKGEILGIAGLMGSRRTEIVETLFGVRHRASGDVTVHGKPVTIRHPEDAIKNGLALLTEERRRTGIFGTASITFNTTLPRLNAYRGKTGLLNDKKLTEDTKWVIDRLNVRTPSQHTRIENLSGGNQQKVVLGRWLLNAPDIMMLDEPTRGIDVGAKYEIYQLIIDLASQGKSVILISSEMPELLGVTDRILVMSNGRVAGIVKTSEADQETLLRLSAKYL